jgi:Uma2 family endonuclease
VNGVILSVSPESRLHVLAVRHVDELLNGATGGRSWSNGSIRLSNSSLWDPDVYVLAETFVDGTVQYPAAGDVELVVEVCVNSKQRDLGDKLQVYAAEGVPVYWVLDPDLQGWLLVHRRPVNGTYHSIERIDLVQGYHSIDASMVATYREALA